MIYASFILWFFVLIFAGIGVYHIASRLIGPKAVSWLLLPGTLISEMAWILGCLLTGGEVRRAKLIHADGSNHGEGTESAGGVKRIGPLLSAMFAIVACATAVIFLDRWLGQSVLKAFTLRGVWVPQDALPQTLPTSWDGFWTFLSAQPAMMRRLCETFGDLTWSQWQTPVFVYLSICLTVRLAPARRNLRATLVAVVVLCGLLGILGAIWQDFAGSINDVWPLLAYLYALALTLLALMLVLWAAVSLIRVLTGRFGPAKD
jgi:hypothetical protein